MIFFVCLLFNVEHHVTPQVPPQVNVERHVTPQVPPEVDNGIHDQPQLDNFYEEAAPAVDQNAEFIVGDDPPNDSDDDSLDDEPSNGEVDEVSPQAIFDNLGVIEDDGNSIPLKSGMFRGLRRLELVAENPIPTTPKCCSQHFLTARLSLLTDVFWLLGALLLRDSL